jgi:16S rRNA (guanine(966)-N(2))-methyltransferase RsmD
MHGMAAHLHTIMRVIAGVHRGRRLIGPTGQAIRPTADRVKEALFSILGERTPGSRFLDLYAGTGAIGIEALSRGAAHVTFVEANRQALRLLQTNLDTCGLAPSAQISRCRVEQFFRRGQAMIVPYDIIFCDPPYEITADIITRMDSWDQSWLSGDGVLVVEHARTLTLPQAVGTFRHVRRYDYGDTALTVWRVGSKDVRPS